MKQKLNCYFYLICTLLLASCTGNTLYYSYHPTPITGWDKKDTLYFNIQLKDSLQLLNIQTDIRNNAAYPYNNIALIISHNFKNKSRFELDTIYYHLTDEEGNRNEHGWSCLSPSSNRLKPIFVRDSGHYQIKIYHGMSDDLILGIHDIGIKIER